MKEGVTILEYISKKFKCYSNSFCPNFKKWYPSSELSISYCLRRCRQYLSATMMRFMWIKHEES